MTAGGVAGAAPEAPWGRWKRAATVVAFGIGLLVLVEVIDLFLNGWLDNHGIVPRDISGLPGILWAPLLHADFAHLIANVTTGVVLGFLVVLGGRGLSVTAIIWLVSGLGVWLTGPSGIPTVGASGLVFGWLTYLIVRGVFNRDIWQILVGVVIALVYGGVLWGVLPTAGHISWQGHLFGAIGGVLAAWIIAPSRDRRPAVPGSFEGGLR